MASIKVVLYKSKTLSNGEHPIMLRIIQDRKPKYINLGVSCNPDLWDKETNYPIKKHPLYKELDILINRKKLEASKLILDLENEEKTYSSEEFKKKLKKNRKNSKTTVFEYFDEIIERLKSAGRLGYARVFKNTKNSLKTFRNDKDFYFSDIDNSFLLKYENDFYSRGVLPNSVFVFLRTFKTLINYAKKDDLVKSDFDPYKEINFSKFRSIKTQKRAISKADIQKIASLTFEPESDSFHSKNFFLFSFYCRGLNFIDLAYLKWSDVKRDRLTYTRKKTKELFNISLLEPAKEILQYYKEVHGNGKGGYIFPILSENHTTLTGQRNRIIKILRRTNKDLKTIATSAGIKEKLTTYVARHSFATILKKSGVSTSIISEALGHESERTTQVYLDSFGNTVIDEASKSIL